MFATAEFALNLQLNSSRACVSSVVGLWYRVGVDAWGDVTYDLVPVLIWVSVGILLRQSSHADIH